MSGKKLLLKYEDATEYCKNARRTSMDLGAYFVSLQYVLMGSVFISIILIFLYAYYGKDEEQINQ
jgi:hypothetical protein